MYRIAVTNRRLSENDFLERIRQLATGAFYDAIVLREKDMGENEYIDLAGRVIAICRKHGKHCILHNFPEAARALSHPYLHLPLSVWEHMSKPEQMALRQEMKGLGTSVHSEGQLEAAVNLKADYVFAGHIFATDCKRDVPPRGLPFLKNICLASPVPVFAIGGISEDKENAVLAQGAIGACYMSASMRGRT